LKTACVVALTALLAAPALAQRGEPTLQSSDVTTVTKDVHGRMDTRTTRHYNPDGELTAVNTIAYQYQGRRLHSTENVRTTADGALVSTLYVRYTRKKDGNATKIRRRWTNAAGEQLRYEIDRIKPDKRAGVTLTTTTVRDAKNEHTETRYSINTHVRGKLVSTDVSMFTPQGAQTGRRYAEYRQWVTERWTFDDNDEITRHAVETHIRAPHAKYDTAISTEIFDGGRTLLESRFQRFARRGDGRLKSHVTTWFDASGDGVRRRTTHYGWARDLDHPTTRVTWEAWTD